MVQGWRGSKIFTLSSSAPWLNTMSQQLSTRLFFLFFSILFLTLFSRLAPQDMLRRLRAARRLDWDWSEWASERALDGKQSEEAWWNGEPKTKSWMNIASPWERFLECLQSVMVSWRFSCSSVGVLCETFQKLFRWEPSLREPHKRTSSWVFCFMFFFCLWRCVGGHERFIGFSWSFGC